MIKEAIVLAGGLGTRLREVVTDVPKSMAKVNGRPFLEYQLSYLASWGVKHVVLSVGYKSELIIEHFGRQFNGVDIDYAVEEELLGTGGGVMKAFSFIKGYNAFVLNGDTFFEVNLSRLSDYQRIKECDTCIVLRFVDDISRYGSVKMDEEYRIVDFTEKGVETGEGYINGGVYLLNKDDFTGRSFPLKFSIEKDYFEKYYLQELFFGLRCFSFFRDIGVPEDYYAAQDEFKLLQY